MSDYGRFVYQCLSFLKLIIFNGGFSTSDMPISTAGKWGLSDINTFKPIQRTISSVLLIGSFQGTVVNPAMPSWRSKYNSYLCKLILTEIKNQLINK